MPRNVGRGRNEHLVMDWVGEMYDHAEDICTHRFMQPGMITIQLGGNEEGLL